MKRARMRKAGCHKGQHAAQGHIVGGTRDGEAREAGGEDGGGGGVGPHHQVPGGAEQGKERHGDEDDVEAGDHRGAGDLGVAHGLGDVQGRQGDARHDVRRQPGPGDGKNPQQDR